MAKKQRSYRIGIVAAADRDACNTALSAIGEGFHEIFTVPLEKQGVVTHYAMSANFSSRELGQVKSICKAFDVRWRTIQPPRTRSPGENKRVFDEVGLKQRRRAAKQ